MARLLLRFVATSVVALLYTALLTWYIPLNGLWAGDQGMKLVQIESLLLNKFSDLALPYPGSELDPMEKFSPLPTMLTWKHGGRYYSAFSYPYAALTAPLFFFFGYSGLYIIPVLATLLTLNTSAMIAEKLSVRPAWLVPLVLGLATPLGFYALVLWEHALATCLTTLALWCVLDALEREYGRQAFVSGIIAAIAFWMRPEAIWFMPALLVGMISVAPQRWRLCLAFAGGLTLGLAPLLVFYKLLFGTLLGPHIALNYSVPDLATPERFLMWRWPIARVLLFDANGQLWLWAFAALMGLLIVLPVPRARPWLVLALSVPGLYTLLATYPLDLHTGLVGTCPLGLLAGLAGNYRRYSAGRLLSVVVVIYIVGVLLSAPNDGGAQWGPRYLLPVVALLGVLGLRGALRLLHDGSGARRRLIGIALVGLLAVCVWTQVRGLQVLLRSTHDTLHIVQVLNARPRRVILTDTWYAPQILPQLYFDHHMFLIKTPKQYPQLHAFLQSNQIAGFSYLTGQPWGSDQRSLDRAGFQCTLVETLPLALALLDCQVKR